MFPRLPPHLHPECELAGARAWLIRDVHSGERFVIKRCLGMAESLMKRWRHVTKRADGHLVIERDLLVRDDGVVALRPYVEGRTLRQLRNAPFERAAELLLDLAFDLEALHRRGVVHGNLHANNVIVDEAGRPRLVDYLESRASDHDGVVVAAPEQLRGHTPTPRTDVHSLGALGFELLVGRPPFSGPRLEAIRRALYDEAALSPEEERGLPPGIATVLRKAMAKSPAARFASAEKFASALRKLVPGAAVRRQTYPQRAPQEVAIQLARDLALIARRFQELPRPARIGLPAVILLLALGSWLAAALSHTRALNRRVEALLAAGDTVRAQRLVAADERRYGRDAAHDKLLGDVSCARGEHEECLQRYERALRESSRYASDERLRANALAMVAREDRGGAIARLLAKVDGVERALVQATRSEQYWTRWNAVHALERRGDHRDIDYVQVHSLDLLHAGSCSTRKAALSRLMQIGDRAALQVLEQARAQPEASSCLGDDLPRAIDQLASAR